MKTCLCCLTIVILSLTSCINDTPNLSGTYHGFWYETSFAFTFHTNGEFSMETGGHFGQTITHGEYAMLDTTVFLLPDSDDVLDNNFGTRISKLRYDARTDCLRDFQERLYCQDENQLYQLGEGSYDLQRRIKEYLISLPEVENYIRVQTDTTVSFEARPKIEFDYVRTLKQRHYWQYRLMVDNPEKLKSIHAPFFLPARMTPFLVDVKNLKVYREERSVNKPLRYAGQVPK